jgi:hypothetical protein
MATLDDFRKGFKGVRGNRFRVSGVLNTVNAESSASPQASEFEFYCKAASIPGSGVGVIPVGYKGRPIKFSGERTYTDWVVSIYDSSTLDLREKFEDWIEGMDRRNEHEINYNNANSNWTVEYMDMDGTKSDSNYRKKIRLINCFPIDLSAMEMSYDIPDTFAEFAVTFAYDRWEYAI